MPEYTEVRRFPSESTAGKEYTVKLRDDGVLTCDCPTWVFNRKHDAAGNRTCKHIQMVQAEGQQMRSIAREVKSRKAEASGGSLAVIFERLRKEDAGPSRPAR